MLEFFEKLNPDDPFRDLVNRVMYVGGMVAFTGLVIGMAVLAESGKLGGKGQPQQDTTPVKPDTTFVINKDTLFYAKQNQHVR